MSAADREMHSDRSYRNKTHGWQGCTLCDDPGFYGYRYSKEGYCYKCELKSFPERYYPCICCRRPQKGIGHMCMDCQIGIKDHFNREEAFMTRFNQWLLYIEQCKPKPGSFCQDFLRKPFTTSEWPGFYLGDKRWEKFDIFPKLDSNGVVIQPLQEFDK